MFLSIFLPFFFLLFFLPHNTCITIFSFFFIYFLNFSTSKKTTCNKIYKYIPRPCSSIWSIFPTPTCPTVSLCSPVLSVHRHSLFHSETTWTAQVTTCWAWPGWLKMCWLKSLTSSSLTWRAGLSNPTPCPRRTHLPTCPRPTLSDSAHTLLWAVGCGRVRVRVGLMTVTGAPLPPSSPFNKYWGLTK